MKEISKIFTLISCMTFMCSGICVHAVSDEPFGLGAEKYNYVDDLYLTDIENLIPTDPSGEIRVNYERQYDEYGTEYIKVNALYAAEKTGWEFVPLTYNHEIAWRKMGGFVPEWEKVKIINEEEVTPESGWYPIVQHYIKTYYDKPSYEQEIIYGDLDDNGVVDITDLSELSLAIIGDKTLTETQIKAADIDENGIADLPDLARLRQFLSKVVKTLK